LKIVKVRFKKGVKRPIKNTQKEYYYLCPIPKVLEGDFVLVDSHSGKNFSVARIEAVYEKKPKEATTVLDSFVICVLPVKDFNKRCVDVRIRKMKIATATKRKQEKIAGG
jgi:hypothetical protein